MAIGANSYGDTGEIAAICPQFVDGTSKIFDTATQPTLLQVESAVDQISAILNSYIATSGFAIPISQADAKLALDIFVNHEAAGWVRGVNHSGRFGPTTKSEGQGWITVLMKEVGEFIDMVSKGWEELGATRTRASTDGIGWRDGDESGDEVDPIFSRDMFGVDFKDYDPA